MFDQRIHPIVRDCIRSFYLTAEKPTVMALYRAVCHQCSISGLTSPSYNTIRARVNAVDLKDLILHRIGPKAARDPFRPVSASSWRGLISEQVASSENVAAFCRERDLRDWKFYEWKKPKPGEWQACDEERTDQLSQHPGTRADL
jgi:hypothetical protein